MNLREAIARYGEVKGDLLMVDRFLNHRVDPEVMAAVGLDIAAWLTDKNPDLILTAEASGIPPALAASREMGIPMVYAKKYLGPGERYTFSREVSSPTKGAEYRVEVARRVLEPGLRVAIVDDFLAGGRTATSLGEIAEEAGCEVVGAIFAIEKTFAGGRELLESHGWDVHALVGITSLDGGGVEIAG
ncbi:MAG: phosphoribosyltransferase family protein [Acidimicrobiia bacterium]|nr:phosphoribosyltransferase family protein [Acidimicrobiia bacterium]